MTPSRLPEQHDPVASPSPLANNETRSCFSAAELAVVRRAYARQMLAVLGVDHPAIDAAFAAVPREPFLGPPPWTAASPFGGFSPLPGTDPVVLYQDLVIALDPSRGVNNGSPSLHAKLLDALGPKAGEHVVHVGAGGGYYSAILAELVGPAGRVTAVEFDPALAKRAQAALASRTNVRVVQDDGACWPKGSAEGVYVNFAVARPADRWIEGLAPGGRLGFPLGVPAPQRPDAGGRHSERGAALRIERRGDTYAAEMVSSAYFVCAEGTAGDVDAADVDRLRESFAASGPDQVRSLVWKRPPPPDPCWFIGTDWALTSAPP